MHTSRKRPKAGPAKSAATTVRRKKPVQVTQPGDSDDSSAIIIVIKKKAAKGIVLFSLVWLRFLPLFSSSKFGRSEKARLRGKGYDQ
jgi:hypothetical protein